MPHAFHQLYYHFAWATHSREPLLYRRWRQELLLIINNEEVRKRGGWPIRHNAMPDHLHLLRLPPSVRISDFIGELKGATSFRINRDLQPRFKLRWQEGYGVLTLRKEELEAVSRYIDNQEEHHRKGRVSALLEMTEAAEADWPEGGEREAP